MTTESEKVDALVAEAMEESPEDVSSDGESDVEESKGADGGAPKVRQNKNERKARKLLSKLGLKPVEGVNKVCIKKSKQVFFVVSKPDVYKLPNSDTYVIFGEAKVEDTGASSALETVQRLSQLSSALQAVSAATASVTNMANALSAVSDAAAAAQAAQAEKEANQANEVTDSPEGAESSESAAAGASAEGGEAPASARSEPKGDEAASPKEGEAAPAAAVDESGVNQGDVELVVSQVGCTREEAVEALLKNKGDIVESIMSLST
ncbi:NAC domain containing protein, putative [Babesia bigemina]|uniref:NAC domain containing protein, putative n=1 Tax=Babesia bigemina TaxID=5866 RepID=A0A061DA56_BABBI|nr:NAC domain containing protein, putative [Babesia bigemina]CDR97418.1 NAC domain containing protein, putative [Babesia bigemina]|eukprot:XP_012769604.1 NAC domain containing protein, putative [Babesia bigemina]